MELKHNNEINSHLIFHTCVIIPTYNNAGTILDVIIDTYNYISNIIVVNDGSTDETSTILSETNIPITIVEYKDNKGKGYALKQGFKKAKGLGFKYAITIDSDGQHKPSDIPVLIKAEEKNIGSIIVGSRELGDKEISKGSLFANRFSNFWFYLQTGCYLSDTQTGYRLYPLDKIYGLNYITNRYESELELLVFSEWHNTKLVSTPIDVYYPPREERISHFRPIKDFTRISLLNTFLCIGAVLYGYPLKLFRLFRTVIYTVFSLLFFLVGAFITTIFAIVYFAICPKNEKTKLNYHKLLWLISKFVIHNIPGVKFQCENRFKETFEKPAVIISNHQSHLDLMCAMMLTPKMVILTNDWVWNNPFYGKIIQFAEFYPVSNGFEESLTHIKDLVSRGYSVLVYPEGTRSADCSILRFHRGAFYIAEELNLDIIPLFIHGPGKVLPKTSFYLKTGKIFLDIKERIKPTDLQFGKTFRERTKKIEQYYKNTYNRIKITKTA